MFRFQLSVRRKLKQRLQLFEKKMTEEKNYIPKDVFRLLSEYLCSCMHAHMCINANSVYHNKTYKAP